MSSSSSSSSRRGSSGCGSGSGGGSYSGEVCAVLRVPLAALLVVLRGRQWLCRLAGHSGLAVQTSVVRAVRPGLGGLAPVDVVSDGIGLGLRKGTCQFGGRGHPHHGGRRPPRFGGDGAVATLCGNVRPHVHA